MKKKILALCLMAVLVFGVTACGSSETDSNVSDDVDNSVDADVDTDEDIEADVDAEDEVAESEGVLLFDVPEGFAYDEESNSYKSTDGNSLANFNYISNSNDGSFNDTTEALIEEALEESLTTAYGETIDLTISKWENIKVDEYDAISYEIEYVYSGLTIVQTQVIVNGTEQLHFVTFTNLKDDGYDDIFATCIDSFRFE